MLPCFFLALSVSDSRIQYLCIRRLNPLSRTEAPTQSGKELRWPANGELASRMNCDSYCDNALASGTSFRTGTHTAYLSYCYRSVLSLFVFLCGRVFFLVDMCAMRVVVHSS